MAPSQQALGIYRHRDLIKGVVSALLLMAGMQYAYAFGPLDALSYRSNAAKEAEKRTDALRQVYNTSINNFRVIAKPGTSFTPNEDLGIASSVSVGYCHDSLISANAKREMTLSQIECDNYTRETIFDALTAHAELWFTQMQVRVDNARLTVASITKEDADLRKVNGGIDATGYDLILQQVETCELTFIDSNSLLAVVKQKAKTLGFDDTAIESTIFFHLPDVAIETCPQYIILRLDSDAAAAKALESSRAARISFFADGIYRDGENYLLGRVERNGRVGQFEVGRGLNINYPFEIYADGVTAVAGISIPLDQSSRAGAKAAEADKRTKAAYLADKTAILTADLRYYHQLALNYQTQLALKRKDCLLSHQVLENAMKRQQLGLVSKVDLARAEVETAQVDFALAVCWKQYITAVYEYLSRSGGQWQVVK